MPTGSYLARRAIYQGSFQDEKNDKLTELEQQPQERDVEIGSLKFGRRRADAEGIDQTSSGRNSKNRLK